MPAARLIQSSLLLLALIATSAHAAPIYETDFTGDNGTIPTDTTLTIGTTSNMAISSNTMRTITGDARLVYTGSGADSLTNYMVQTTFRRATGGGWTGIVARAQTTAGNQSAYLLRLNRVSSAEPAFNQFQLYYVNASGALSQLDAIVLPEAQTAGINWRMTLTVQGSTITGQIYNASDTLVGTVSATDSTLTSGTGGVQATHGAASVYDDLSILEIPEPASVGLIAAGSLILVSHRLR